MGALAIKAMCDSYRRRASELLNEVRSKPETLTFELVHHRIAEVEKLQQLIGQDVIRDQFIEDMDRMYEVANRWSQFIRNDMQPGGMQSYPAPVIGPCFLLAVALLDLAQTRALLSALISRCDPPSPVSPSPHPDDAATHLPDTKDGDSDGDPVETQNT